MKKIIFITILSFTFLNLNKAQSVQQKIEQYLQEEAENGFSGTALVVEKGKTILSKAYGWTDRENKVSNHPNTRFSIGSITKDFTMAAILKLEEQGKLSTKDPLSTFFKKIPDDKKTITVHQLLRHSSGLDEYHDEGEFEQITKREALKRIFKQELRFEPGSDRAYSNSGYTLLAAIVESASGQPFEDYIRSFILAPAGLSAVPFFGEIDKMKAENVAIGYDGVSFGRQNSPYYWGLTAWQLMGAGGLVMSLEELYQWVVALKAGKILSPKGTKRFLEEYNQTIATSWCGNVRAFAGGNDHGFTMIYFELADKNSYALLASNTMSFNADRTGKQLARLVCGLEVEAPVEAEPFQAKTREEWGLPDTKIGEKASGFLNAICQNDKAVLKDFIKNNFSDELYKSHPEEAHINFLTMVYDHLQVAPKLHDIKHKDDLNIVFYMQSDKTGEDMKVVLGLQKKSPHRIENILIGD